VRYIDFFLANHANKFFMKPVVLILSTYPFAEPRHGGQVRMANIAQSYQKWGMQVESIAICEADGYSSSALGRRDIPFPTTSAYRNYCSTSTELISDLQSGRYGASDDGFKVVKKRLPNKIDVIHVEQPWLWPVARRIIELPAYAQARLVYGSQNIEAPLKRQILHNQDYPYADVISDEIDALEKEACTQADLVFSVTKSDCEVLQNWGGKKVILAENGISPWHADQSKIDEWSKKLPSIPWLLYVASAHPPNYESFSECLGNSLGCFPPDSRLVIAGSVSDYIQREFSGTRWHTLNSSRLQLLNVLSDEDLAAVKILAHGFLLPITHGGGSNIKTPEALYSGAYVIGSELAFRGFEVYADRAQVRVARNPAQFHESIREVLAAPRRTVSAEESDGPQRASLTWDVRLAGIPAAVSEIIRTTEENK
jgi:hypothetical protein